MLNPDAHLDTEGAVIFPGGIMHPYSFRDIFGEDAYQELLARPRVPSPYGCCLRGDHENDLTGERYNDMPNNPGADAE